MNSITDSGRRVKPDELKRPTKTTQLIRAHRRAKAKPAPWAGAAYDLTEQGRALIAAPEPLAIDDLIAAVAEIGRRYDVRRDGDHLRFQGTVTGDFARVSLPGSEPYTWLGSKVTLPAEAFEAAAANWFDARQGTPELRRAAEQALKEAL